MKTSEFIKGKEDQVLSLYGYAITGNRHVDCPICGGKKKLRINRFHNSVSYICTCGNGSLLSFLVLATGRDYAGLARDIDTQIGNTYENEKPEKQEKCKTTEAINFFKSGERVFNNTGSQYLNSRGINSLPEGGIIYHPAAYCPERQGRHGALFAIASDNGGRPVYTHTTYIHESGKADIETQKRMHTVAEFTDVPVSVKLFPLAETLGVAEGIESALAGRQIDKANVWSLLNKTLMSRFKAPRGVKRLIIYADNDKNVAGLAGAMECAHKNIIYKNNDVSEVIVKWSSAGDFNDHLNHGGELFKWVARA